MVCIGIKIEIPSHQIQEIFVTGEYALDVSKQFVSMAFHNKSLTSTTHLTKQ